MYSMAGPATIRLGSGNAADYTIASGQGGSVTVTDNRAIPGNDGSDTLTGVEFLSFADQTFGLPVAQDDGLPAAALELSTLNGANGFTINGIDQDDLSGISVSAAGDINNDGFDDIIIGAVEADPAGESYVLFGSASGFAPEVNLSALEFGTGDSGFVIKGVGENNRSGGALSGAGDVNGDGIDDSILGGSGALPAGEAYVVFGRDTTQPGVSFDSVFELSTLGSGTGDNGFVITGISAFDSFGVSVSSAGDINGDTYDDLIIGATGADPGGRDRAGASYVVFGRDTSLPGESFGASFKVSSAFQDGRAFVINGIEATDFSGRAVSGAGDVNGDGVDDLIIGASDADRGGQRDIGESYVVFGRDVTARGQLRLEIRAVDARVRQWRRRFRDQGHR